MGILVKSVVTARPTGTYNKECARERYSENFLRTEGMGHKSISVYLLLVSVIRNRPCWGSEMKNVLVYRNNPS